MLSSGTDPAKVSTMVDLNVVVGFLDEKLQITSIPDYPGSVNGLQLANGGKIERIIAAVDASGPVIEAAASGGPGLLVVHHGLFWQGAQPIAGSFYRKIKRAMDAELAIYSCHLPLDVHPEWGNNILLARAIGLAHTEPFLERKGMLAGIAGEFSGNREALVEAVTRAVGGSVHVCAAGPGFPRRVGIITGGAGSEVADVAASGIDTFVTGEGPHWSYTLAEELGLNVIYAGHYATETFGVRKLAEVLAGNFGLPSAFIDHPTGL